MAHIGAAVASVVLIGAVLWDAFETIILPRSIVRRFRLARAWVRAIWLPWRLIAVRVRSARRERFLAIFGPIALLGLIALWAICLIIGFGGLHWAAGSHLEPIGVSSRFSDDLYMSGTTFTTLGLGDVHPVGRVARLLTVVEAATGFAFFAIVVAYLPVLYQSFSRREARIVMLDEWAGSPPSASVLLLRSAEAGEPTAIVALFKDWEIASAELLESHLSYPVLAYFRSQHDNQSWLAALTTILDASSLAISGLEWLPTLQARLTFAIARHALVDLSQVFRVRPIRDGTDRLPLEDLDRLRDQLAGSGLHLRRDEAALKQLAELRAMYEPYALALSRHLMMPLPTWLPPQKAKFNWQTTAWERTGSRDLH